MVVEEEEEGENGENGEEEVEEGEEDGSSALAVVAALGFIICSWISINVWTKSVGIGS